MTTMTADQPNTVAAYEAVIAAFGGTVVGMAIGSKIAEEAAQAKRAAGQRADFTQTAKPGMASQTNAGTYV